MQSERDQLPDSWVCLVSPRNADHLDRDQLERAPKRTLQDTLGDRDGVEMVFATPSSDPEGESDDEPAVRFDLDGKAAASEKRDVGEEGDNVQVSAWLPLDRAVELRDELTEAIEGARDRERE